MIHPEMSYFVVRMRSRIRILPVHSVTSQRQVPVCKEYVFDLLLRRCLHRSAAHWRPERGLQLAGSPQGWGLKVMGNPGIQAGRVQESRKVNGTEEKCIALMSFLSRQLISMKD